MQFNISTDPIVFGNWSIVFTFIKAVLFLFSLVGILCGLFVIISPRYAFLLIRALNKYIYTITTKDVDLLLQNELIEKKVYLKYNTVFSFVIFVSSLALLVLISRQIFF